MSSTSLHRAPVVDRRVCGTDAGATAAPVSAAVHADQNVQRFIDAHREIGYRCATLDPLGLSSPMEDTALQPQRFGLSPTDPLTPSGSPLWGLHEVHELDRHLKGIYCGSLALDASAVRDEARRAWLHARMESALSDAQEGAGIGLLARLIQVQAWEQHVAERFPNGKRFSLEGCEALVPLLDALVQQGAAHGISEIFMGMPHRGRVNVLVNVFGVPAAQILDYFDPDTPHPERHRDLVYHQGARRCVATDHGEVALTLACNPSHLQSVYPVVMGMTHASQASRGPHRGTDQVMAIMMHGDAAFAGQGVVTETLVLTNKPGYTVGGTVHIVINNQVGFTEPNLMDAQAPRYCTDVTRVVDAPVLRVNADAPVQVLRAAAIAVAYRMTFGSDVVIDLIGYRRLGHSEHDEPAVTSPRAYPMATFKPSVVDAYGAALAAEGVASDADMATYMACARAAAMQCFAAPSQQRPAAAEDRLPLPALLPFDRRRLQAAVAAMTRLPETFQPHPKVDAIVGQWRRHAQDDGAPVDWCFAENMAYASILEAGMPVRITGLDVQRGTFMHRHAVWHNQRTDGSREHVPLKELGRARFDIHNTMLSEEAVLGFEYGYSVQDRRGLTIWEAQFGDFVNGAQVFIDQYVSTGEEKWGYSCGLVLLLPHGYEGVGPEHSNAYLSRFLQLCGADNMRVAVPSTAAQWFHLLRRQACDAHRKPLVVMTPKATLYSEKASYSTVGQLHEGEFEPVLDDDGIAAPSQVTRLVVCSGKVFYDLVRARDAAGNHGDVALLRVEQLYPFPKEALARLFERYHRASTVAWVQEEARNQGPWSHVRDELAELCPQGVRLEEVSRATTAAGATSSPQLHRQQQRALTARALGR